MPKLSPGQPFGPIPATVTLDGSGNGTVQFQAVGSSASITNLFGKVAPVSPATTPTNQAVVDVYVGPVSTTTNVFHNNSGSTGFTATGRIDVPDGTIINVVWTGGDPGAVATATFSGRAIPFDQIVGGFEMRADDPIAAGDGTLIYPALRSPNYVAGTSGWQITRDGNVDIADANVRGTLYLPGAGTSYISINDFGTFNAVEIEPDGTGMPATVFPGYMGAFSDTVAEVATLNIVGTAFPATHRTSITLGADFNLDGYLTIDASETFTVTANSTYITSPITTHTGQFTVAGDLIVSGSNTATSTNFSGTTLKILDIQNNDGSNKYGRGWIAAAESTSNSAGVNATETIVLTLSSTTFEANRAYRIVCNGRWANGTGVAHNALIRWRKTNLAGAALTDVGRMEFPTTSGQTLYRAIDCVFITSSQVTAVLVMTVQSVAGGTGLVQAGAAGSPRRFDIYDIGPSSDFSNYTTLT